LTVSTMYQDAVPLRLPPLDAGIDKPVVVVVPESSYQSSIQERVFSERDDFGVIPRECSRPFGILSDQAEVLLVRWEGTDGTSTQSEGDNILEMRT